MQDFHHTVITRKLILPLRFSLKSFSFLEFFATCVCVYVRMHVWWIDGYRFMEIVREEKDPRAAVSRCKTTEMQVNESFRWKASEEFHSFLPLLYARYAWCTRCVSPFMLGNETFHEPFLARATRQKSKRSERSARIKITKKWKGKKKSNRNCCRGSRYRRQSRLYPWERSIAVFFFTTNTDEQRQKEKKKARTSVNT